eukprot:3457214-Rhodomonas_salina.1
MQGRASILRACYAVCGTDVAYGGGGHVGQRRVRRSTTSTSSELSPARLRLSQSQRRRSTLASA